MHSGNVQRVDLSQRDDEDEDNEVICTGRESHAASEQVPNYQGAVNQQSYREQEQMEDDREMGQGIENQENQDSLQSMNDNESV